MAHHNSNGLSESEEMYLLTIERLSSSFDDGVVPLSHIAEALGIQPVSTNQMVRKLDQEGLLEYQPYKGAKLSQAGERHTQMVLRDRRIWKTFLNQKLGVPIRNADDLACRFEHITPVDVISKLYEFIGEPTHTPEGEPIPILADAMRRAPNLPLSNIAAGERVEVSVVKAEGAAMEFLEKMGIHAGVPLTVLASGGNGAVLVDTGMGQVTLGEVVARMILVAYTSKRGRRHART